jgi:hypothetical protein
VARGLAFTGLLLLLLLLKSQMTGKVTKFPAGVIRRSTYANLMHS